MVTFQGIVSEELTLSRTSEMSYMCREDSVECACESFRSAVRERV